MTKKVFPDGKVTEASSDCICEQRLIIRINGKERYDLVCTCDDLQELITGRLFTDRIILSREDITDISFMGEYADVTIRHTDDNENDLIRCNTITAPSPRKKIDKLTKTTPDTKTVFEIISLFRNDGTLHRSTGGTHRCIIYLCGDTPVHCSFEDISRHNAVDKAVGHAVVKGYDLSRCILFTSGRVPVDMAEKVIAAKIPVLISKSVPTAASVKLAKEYGLTLICKAWQDSFELFS
ncbi:MAG: formate dehydrogenase accessory sulfurtransferase FdhD [Oscillospiraceae bacterium]|nr:formate dehydrogenase accessory sulfurtransferase FdhD [Oscillospiraceae bacterium]